MHLWDLSSSKELRFFKATGACVVALTPDGKSLATSASEAVILRSADTGDAIRQLQRPGNYAWSLAFRGGLFGLTRSSSIHART
jgi:hypothetical protein